VSNVIWHITMSVDGFIAGPDDSMDWAFGHADGDALAEEARDETGAILAGRRWYDAAVAKYESTRGIYGGKWKGPVFVLTHRQAEDPTVTFLYDGLEQAVATARASAGEKSLGIFGASIARQCLDAELLDEIVIHLAPVLLGGGVRLYGGPQAGRIDLERTVLAESGQLADLRFRVKR
jgi:dihydrofolate reductase